MWGRLSPHPAFETEQTAAEEGNGTLIRRVRPTRVAPVTLWLREDAGWLLARHGGTSAKGAEPPLSHAALEALQVIENRGASFFADVQRFTGRLPSEVEDGLWELVAAGIVTADGFENLRALIDPKRRRGEGRGRNARPRHAAGRWALLRESTFERPAGSAKNTNSDDEPGSREKGAANQPGGATASLTVEDLRPAALRAAPVSSGVPDQHAEATEAFARQLLARWGVVFRDLVKREALAPAWRDLLVALRRLEARGEIRGGRFAQAFVGEQFALPEAVELLRSVRRHEPSGEEIVIGAADPLNLAGVILPGPRVSATASETLRIRDGVLIEEEKPPSMVSLAMGIPEP